MLLAIYLNPPSNGLKIKNKTFFFCHIVMTVENFNPMENLRGVLIRKVYTNNKHFLIFF